MRNWLAYGKRRFEAAETILLTLLYSISVASYLTATENIDINPAKLILAPLLTLLFFFRYQLSTEIQTDSLLLRQGPINLAQAKKTLLILFVLDIALFSLAGLDSAVVALIAAAYFYLFHWGFFARKKLKPLLTTRQFLGGIAVYLHTLAIFTFLSGSAPWDWHVFHWVFTLIPTFLFHFQQICKLCLAKEQEKTQRLSYSKIWGHQSAFSLALMPLAGAMVCLRYSLENPLAMQYKGMTPWLTAATIGFVLISTPYFFWNKKWSGALMQKAATIVTLIFFIVSILGFQNFI